jgi:hypothetical protein
MVLTCFCRLGREPKICFHREKMTAEPPPPDAPKPPRVRFTPEDLERFRDEEAMRRESNDDWLRDEAPPHHR